MREPFQLSERLWEPQRRGVEQTIAMLEQGKDVCLQGPTGSGKCLEVSTPVLLFSGKVVRADEVRVGDALMGPDSTPRNVLSTSLGHGLMYDVIPTKGDTYTVNSDHILTLKMSANGGWKKKGDVFDISISDYLSASDTFRWVAKGLRCAVDFPDKGDPPVSPYVIGAWLGDGFRASASLCLSDKDKEFIVPELKLEADRRGLEVHPFPEKGACERFSICQGNGRSVNGNTFLNDMRLLGLIGADVKSVPEIVRCGSRATRLDAIAGLLDTDGCLGHSKVHYDVVFKYKDLADDLVFMCRSVGLSAYTHPCTKGIRSTGFTGTYYRISISGDLDMIPMRVPRKRAAKRTINKNNLHVGIKVVPAGEGDWAGWTLDGDGRFLLGDFTVTHNTTAAAELVKWSSHHGIPSCFYANRRLLIGQTYKRFTGDGIDVGVRAAEFDELWNPSAMCQICSADTERSRVYRSKRWGLHDAGLIIIDELHLQRTDTMYQIIKDYKAAGAQVVGLTATPIGVSHMVDELVVSGTMQDYRECGAIVPAVVRSIEQPDISKVKRRADGEFVYDGKEGVEWRKRFTQQIVGNVIDRWKRYNPDARPTLLYAPGCEESAWFTEQFWKHGVRWAHIDANEIYVDGSRYKRTRPVWDDLVEMLRNGDIRGISSRFVLREGVDIPFAYHAILACPIGSLASYIQTVGRILRYSPETPDTVLVTDHGANFWRHGSPNENRPWREWWHMDEGEVSRQKERIRREKGGDSLDADAREPIRCPQCETERRFGPKCPICGYECPKGKRHVIMVDGKIREVEGPLVKRVRTQKRSDTEKKWTDMFFAWRNSKNTQEKTMAQLEAFFTYTYGYHPSRELPFMPRSPRDWHQRVSTVDFDLLNYGERK